ncbi:MAG: hypothetical protein Q7T61_14990 [Caulobacter sp.]|nr:hypothetical protein [Caulobacter sp.]
MDRRAFIAGAGAAVAAPIAAQAQTTGAGKGETVSIRGYLKRVTNHYYVIAPTAQKTDPKTNNYAAWPTDVVRVYPKDAGKMTLGLVTIKGRFYKGRQMDAASGTVATVVLTDAVMN